MTERCQTKFTEKIGNRNYIICGGIVVALLAILITYRCVKFKLLSVC